VNWHAWPGRLSRWFALAVGIGLLDLSVTIWAAPPDYAFPPTALRALSLSTTLALAALAAARLAFAPLLRRPWPGLFTAGAAITWAWLVLLVAAPSNRLLSMDGCRADALVCGAHFSRVVLPALAVAPAFMLAARALAAGDAAAWRQVAGTTLVPLLALAAAAEWYVVYGAHPRGFRGTWPALIAFVVLAPALMFSVARWRCGRAVSRSTCAVGIAIVALGPAWLPMWAFARERTADAAVRADGPDLVLLVTADALRADAVSYDLSGHTPNLARLARESTVFSRAISPSSWTLPTFGTWLTGLSPDVHEIDASGRLPAAVMTLPEVLRQAGYVTGAIVENPLFAPPSDFAVRFDEAVPLTLSSVGTAPRMAMSVGPRVWSAAEAAGWNAGTGSAVTRLAADWLERVSTGRAFLWVHYLEPHAPYTPSAEARLSARKAASLVADDEYKAYLGEVAQVDLEIGRLLDTLRARGRYDRALIIFTSDHGEEFGEHGGIGHGRHLSREVIEVPLLVKLPGARVGRVEPLRVSTQSLFGTVLDACGVSSRGPAVESASLLSLARGESGGAMPEPTSWLVRFASSRGRPQAALYLGDFKYERLFEPDEERLYDLRSDPTELRSVAAEHPDIVEEGRRRLAREREVAASLRRALRISGHEWDAMDPDRIEALRSLGYVQ
jgi:arylsulfatase A-like enzyme